MIIPEHVQTARLEMRRSAEQHAEAIYTAYATDVEVTKYFSWRPHSNIIQTIDFLQPALQAWEAKQEYD